MTARPSVVLVGASGTGKSTVAPLLADRLGYVAVDLDDLRSAWYADDGVDQDHQRRLFEAGEIAVLLAYWKPFELRSVERVMAAHGTGHVIAFGAGQTVYSDPADRARAAAALAPAAAVVRLVPSADPEEARALVEQRQRADPDRPPPAVLETFLRLTRDWVDHPSTLALATHTLVTGGADAGPGRGRPGRPAGAGRRGVRRADAVTAESARTTRSSGPDGPCRGHRAVRVSAA